MVNLLWPKYLYKGRQIILGLCLVLVILNTIFSVAILVVELMMGGPTRFKFVLSFSRSTWIWRVLIAGSNDCSNISSHLIWEISQSRTPNHPQRNNWENFKLINKVQNRIIWPPPPLPRCMWVWYILYGHQICTFFFNMLQALRRRRRRRKIVALVVHSSMYGDKLVANFL